MLNLLEIMKKHLSIGVKVYDPYCQKQVVDNQMFDFEEFVASIDALVVMVAHDEIKKSFKKHLVNQGLIRAILRRLAGKTRKLLGKSASLRVFS